MARVGELELEDADAKEDAVGDGGGGGGLSAEGTVGVTWGESMSIRDTVRSRGGGGCWATRGDDWTGDIGVLLGPAAGAWRWRGERGLDARAL